MFSTNVKRIAMASALVGLHLVSASASAFAAAGSGSGGSSYSAATYTAAPVAAVVTLTPPSTSAFMAACRTDVQNHCDAKAERKTGLAGCLAGKSGLSAACQSLMTTYYSSLSAGSGTITCTECGSVGTVGGGYIGGGGFSFSP